MNAGQLESILKNNRHTAKYFIGVFASNNIPKPKKIKSFPCSFIANTGKLGTVGEHWVACFVNSAKHIEYFDSLAELPNNDITAYLNQYDKVLVTRRIVQNPFSDTCGHFCIYFLVTRSAGIPYCDVMETLYKTRYIDYLVKFFVQKLEKS